MSKLIYIVKLPVGLFTKRFNIEDKEETYVFGSMKQAKDFLDIINENCTYQNMEKNKIIKERIE